MQRTVYPYKWLPINCRSGAGQGKVAGQRPTFYHWATPLTIAVNLSCFVIISKRLISELLLNFIIILLMPVVRYQRHVFRHCSSRQRLHSAKRICSSSSATSTTTATAAAAVIQTASGAVHELRWLTSSLESAVCPCWRALLQVDKLLS